MIRGKARSGWRAMRIHRSLDICGIQIYNDHGQWSRSMEFFFPNIRKQRSRRSTMVRHIGVRYFYLLKEKTSSPAITSDLCSFQNSRECQLEITGIPSGQPFVFAVMAATRFFHAFGTAFSIFFNPYITLRIVLP